MHELRGKGVGDWGRIGVDGWGIQLMEEGSGIGTGEEEEGRKRKGGVWNKGGRQEKRDCRKETRGRNEVMRRGGEGGQMEGGGDDYMRNRVGDWTGRRAD